MDFEGTFLCASKTNPQVTTETAEITGISGNQSVNGLSIVGQTVNFIPKNIEKFFPNLTILEVVSSELKELRPKDLEPFPKLRALFLSNNSIHIIERDSFKNNKNLEVIWLNNNGVKFIDPFVFDHLFVLRSLNLVGSASKDLGLVEYTDNVHNFILYMREVYSFPAALWKDNEELTNELHKTKIMLEVSAVINALLIFVIVVTILVVGARKVWKNNRVGCDDSRNTSKSSYLFEMSNIRERLNTINFS